MDDTPAVEHDDVARHALQRGDVLLDEHDRGQLANPLQDARDLRDEGGREPLCGLVDEKEQVRVEQRPRDRDHLLLAARERARALAAALAQDREELVHELVPGRGPPHREPQVLVDREPCENVAVLGHVADSEPDDLVRRHGAHVPPVQLHRAARARGQPEQSSQGGRLPDAVPPDERGHAALGDREGDALEDVGLPKVDMQVADSQRAHNGSPM